MTDQFNRIIDYARISITDKCNFRCAYCKPNGNLESQDAMSDEEILQLCSALTKLGIRYLKITGGEPLVRPNIINLLRQMKQIEGIEQVTITTNGSMLESYLEELAAMKIDGINISMDAVEDDLFRNITGNGDVSPIIRSLKRSQQLEIKNVKINCVLIKDVNETEYTKLIELVKAYDISIKFIEMMPIGTGKSFSVYSLHDLKNQIEQKFGTLELVKGKYGNGPAQYYRLNGFKGKIGFIGAITHKFCDQCNRIRITSDGFLKTCLYYHTGVDLKPYFTKTELVEVIEKAMIEKQESHHFDDIDFCNVEQLEDKLMSQIGG